MRICKESIVKKTIISLRGELEALSIKKNEEVQQAISNRESEITQLKLTISSLRTSLDEVKIETNKLIQEKTAELAKEIETLQKGLIKNFQPL